MEFICYPACTTCQKARKWLQEQNIPFTERHIKTQNPTYEELDRWQTLSGLPLKKFFNTSGLAYKSLQLKDRLPGLSREEQLKLLSDDGMLVKRPLLIGDGWLLVGFKEAEWQDRLK